jgi:glycine cleavage system transcriptional repressor
MIIFSKRTGERKYQGNILPYAVEVVSINHASVVYNLTNFFANHSVMIEDLTIYSYQTSHSDTRMFSINLTIGIPADTHIASLREEFMDFCDELNLDAVMEPIKG